METKTITPYDYMKVHEQAEKIVETIWKSSIFHIQFMNDPEVKPTLSIGKSTWERRYSRVSKK